MQQCVDSEGFRLNVGIILVNQDSRVFWAKRIGHDAWQFPQGGMLPEETAEQAMYRELHEEVGLQPEDIQILGQTQDWLSYRLPKQFIRTRSKPTVIGQKQKWFLLRLQTVDEKIRLNVSNTPEFDSWRWVDYRQPLNEIIYFKKAVYQQALDELAQYLPDQTS